MNICKYPDINIKKINYNKPEKNGSFYYSPINYKNEPFYIQSPKMKCTSNTMENIEKGNYNLDSEPINNDFSFYDFFLNLEDRNIKETFKQNKDWFGKDIPLELIDDMYKRTIKPVKKDSKPGFSFKIPVIKNKVQCQIYDQNKICLDVSKLESGAEVVFILHVKGLKFLKNHYYCDCYISQVKIFLANGEKYNIIKEYAFEEDNEIVESDKDILDEEIILEIVEQQKAEKRKKEDKINIQAEILKLQQQLDNL
jgi:hypothetical protein|tara:strand:+ start:264 stop:1025 length:762 start_codon:yes stop_codon:yes gene_type:complete